MSKLFFIAWSVGLLFYAAAGQTQTIRARAKQKAPLSKPFTIERMLVRLQDVANKEYTEAALIKKVDKDGIDFIATSQNLSRLKDAGASESLLTVLRRLAPAPAAPPPPVPKAPPTGTVEVTCAPAECLVGFGERPATATTGGRLTRKGLAPGALSVSVNKEGFISWTGSVKVSANEKASISAALKPTPETQQLWGTQLKDKMITALGGEAGLKDIRSLLSFGDATIWGHDGRKYTSSLEMLLRAPDKAFFRTRAGKRSTFEVEFLPAFRSKSNLQEAEARDTEAGLRLLLKYQIPALMDRLTVPGIQSSAETNEARDGVELQFKSGTEDVVVTLDDAGRPKEVREEQPFGAGIRALYSAYKVEGNGYVPTEISIVWPGSPKQGIVVQFQTFQLHPDLKQDGGYRLKRASRFLKTGDGIH